MHLKYEPQGEGVIMPSDEFELKESMEETSYAEHLFSTSLDLKVRFVVCASMWALK